MKSKAYFLVFDGLADWELAHALCEINKSGKFEIVSVGLSDKSVTTMGGLKLSPDITLDEVTPSEAHIFMLPGGDMWEQESHGNLKVLLHQLHTAGILRDVQAWRVSSERRLTNVAPEPPNRGYLESQGTTVAR
jgi:putative intracellular protease/amidase